MTTSLTTRTPQTLGSFFDRDPFALLQQEMDALLGRFRGNGNNDQQLSAILPSVDLSETNDAVQIRMDVPGMKPEEIDIEVSGNTIRIRGEHREEKEEKGKTYQRLERRQGSFARSFTLPAAVKEGKVTADYQNGVLSIVLPKTEESKTQKVKINGK